MFATCLHSAGVMLVLGVPSLPSLGKDAVQRPDPGPTALTLPPLPAHCTYRPTAPSCSWNKISEWPPPLTLAYQKKQEPLCSQPWSIFHHSLFPFAFKAPDLYPDDHFTVLIAVLDLQTRLLTPGGQGLCLNFIAQWCTAQGRSSTNVCWINKINKLFGSQFK